MKGVSLFVDKNFKSTNITFEKCMQAIVHAYSLVVAEKKYSRKGILNQTTRLKGKKATILELEDYLRNDLVDNFISPNLSSFDLQNYLFVPGAEEASNNIKTGILDIKVCSPSFTGSVYYIFECKRLNKAILKGYLDQGIARFLNGKYYPTSNTPIAGLISFLESSEKKHTIKIDDCYNELNTAFNLDKVKIKLVSSLSPHKLDCEKFQFVKDFKFVYFSNHKRLKNKGTITLYHMFLDYNELIVA